jgi:hypothetical protein
MAPQKNASAESALHFPHDFVSSFQEEYRELLRRHGVDFDERYVT